MEGRLRRPSGLDSDDDANASDAVLGGSGARGYGPFVLRDRNAIGLVAALALGLGCSADESQRANTAAPTAATARMEADTSSGLASAVA